MVDEIGTVKGLRDYGIKEEYAHVTAVAGRAFARQGRKAPTRVGAQTRSAKARSGWGKGAIRMDLEDPCLLTQSPDLVGVEPLRSERGDWLFGMGYWFVALLRPACAGLRRAPATGGWEWGSRIRGTRSRVHFLWLVLKKKKLVDGKKD